MTGSPCLRRGETGRPVAASQTRTVSSAQAVTTWRPSGPKEASVTRSPCRSDAVIGRPVAVSQTRRRPIVAGCNHAVAVRTECGVVHLVGVRQGRGHGLSGLGIPDRASRRLLQ